MAELAGLAPLNLPPRPNGPPSGPYTRERNDRRLRAWLRSFSEPEERLVAAVTHLSWQVGPLMVRLYAASILSEELRPDYEVSPWADLAYRGEEAPWDSSALARWFAAKARSAGIIPDGERRALTTVRKLFGGERRVERSPEPAWELGEWIYVLPNGDLVGKRADSPYTPQLSGHELIRIGNILGTSAPPDVVLEDVRSRGT